MNLKLIASLVATLTSTEVVTAAEQEPGFLTNMVDTLTFKSHFGFKDKEVAAAVSEDFDDRFHTIQQVVEENNYTYGEYNVTTKDGYILTMHRVTKGPVNADNKAYPILIQHGIEDSSFMWVQNSPKLAPAFVFADAGFDVWLGNNRGNEFGQNHTTLDPSQKEFWDFDFEDMGLKDVPAFTDFIIEHTKESNPLDKIAAYVGFSEGTTQFFIGASMNPEYFASKFNMFVAWAPITRIGNESFLGTVSKYEDLLTKVVLDLKFYNIIQTGYYTSDVEQFFCGQFEKTCQFFDSGYIDPTVDNIARLPVKESHSPAGAGWKNLIHYAQIIKNQKFQRWDYGEVLNMKHYNQSTPPEYDLSKINMPFAIGHGSLDSLADPKSVAWLLDESQSGLKIKEHMILQKEYKFGHGTYGLALDGSFLYDDFVPLVKSMSDAAADTLSKQLIQ